ncbi:MAG: long-chain fatty acid--CoA ligase [Porticoccaceae bacterium]|nr:long-chain fatty acid--CoA ligase [Porticoccaceae bacterium]
MVSLPAMILRAARHNPQGIATRFNGREHSWTEFVDRIARLAAGLRDLDIGRAAVDGNATAEAESVALLSLNSDRYFEALFAISWAGYTLVPLNTRWVEAENHYALDDSDSRILFFDDTFVSQVESLLKSVPSLQACVYLGDAECPPWAVSAETLIQSHNPSKPSMRQGDDLAGIFYTGGTTGFPKGVMQPHRALWASAMGALPDFALSRNSVYLHAAPMFHMADMAVSNAATLSAATHIMVPRFDPGAVVDIILNENVTHVILVPAMIKMLLNHSDADKIAASSLQMLVYGASPMPAEILKKCLQVWPRVGLTQAYGQTELAPVVSTLSAQDHREGGIKLKSAGLPTAVSEVRIVAEDGSDCPVGVAGEIWVRGPNAMLGYWNKPEETAKTLKNGWVATGDAGYVNDQGYLFIADRVKDMIISGGENVYTTEVENTLISHPAVADVAVIGIPHEDWGEAVHAIVIVHQGQSPSEKELIDHCRDKIAGYKLPKSISFRDEPMPLSGAGKVLKTELRKPFWQSRDSRIV